MLKFCIASFFIIYFTAAKAQTYEKEYETLFALQVKQINEFVERFNNVDNTLIKLYYKKHYPTKVLTRDQLIKSLFNAEKPNWNFDEIRNFMDTVNNKTKPLKLNLFDDKWYVKLNCPVLWKGRSKTVNLTLHMQPVSKGVYKWVITGVNAPFLRLNKGSKNPSSSFNLPAPQDSTTALNSSSNATDFMNLDKVTSDKNNISNYFIRLSHYNDDLPLFVKECWKGHFAITSPINISYYFEQIPGWLIEVKRFNRQTTNSGWLISALVKTRG